ncbi:MAG: GapA-binding peptide SR1P [Hydrogenibacillus sp.]|nr:GapA-binding peptide SR1P [Hydrogenibacillus sp.]
MGQYVCRSCGRVVGHFETHKVTVLFVRPDGMCPACRREEARYAVQSTVLSGDQ